MSWFSKKKFEENKKEVKSHVESHKVLRISKLWKIVKI